MLVIKEDMRAEGRQDVLLLHTAQEESLVHADAPFPQRLDGALMGRDAAGGHQGCADRRLLLGLVDILEAGQRRQEVCKGALGQRTIHIAAFMFIKGINTALLVNTFS